MTAVAAPRLPIPSFAEVYDEHFGFVWRTVRQLGVQGATIDDVVQETFIVVHRRLAEFEGRSSLKTWLYGIVRRIVRDERRRVTRKPTSPVDDYDAIAGEGHDPGNQAERAEAARLLLRLLAELSDDRREVFVLVELEQMTAPEVAEATGTNVNTVYTRLRAARGDFAAAVDRHRAHDAAFVVTAGQEGT